ncbi:Peptidylprolyl isomerase [Aphelenchoides fujianensis]|nr:Peptidylprolyl isomerase [Aphelenchoides fujianensis]
MTSTSAFLSLLLVAALCTSVASKEEKKEEESGTFEGQKLSWKEDDGLEVKIIRPIKAENCPIKSQAGDTVEQYYKLSDKAGNEIGSNFGKEPYTFKLGAGEVISGMDRAMTGMCVGEKRKVVIPGALGFGDKGRERDNIEKDQVLFYTVQLVDLFRPVPGAEWKEDDGLEIRVTHKIDADKCRLSAPGDRIHQHYKLHLADGTFVDSSFSRNQPFVFKLGAKEVIAGMDRAMTNMCEHEKRHVVIPPALGYGVDGRPPSIPGNATLYFDIELLKLDKKDEL